MNIHTNEIVAAARQVIDTDRRLAAQERAARAAQSELRQPHLAAACGANTKARAH